MKNFDMNLAEIGLGFGRQNSEREWQENSIENSKKLRRIAKARRLISNILPTRIRPVCQFQHRPAKGGHFPRR
jgi:hypothetical protein